MGFQVEKGKIYIAPIVFGPALCALQNKAGKRYRGVQEKVDKYTLAYEVEKNGLEDILPVGFKLLSPHLIINVEALSKVALLAGRSFNRIEVQTPVIYKGKKGLFNMVTWENNGDSIIQDRDIHGIPKVFAHISDMKMKNKVFITSATSWTFRFLDFAVVFSQKAEDEETFKKIVGSQKYEGVFNYRYIPMTEEGFSKSEVNYVTLFPTQKNEGSPQICAGAIEWHYPRFEDMPTQYSFGQKLAKLKPVKYIGASCVTFDRTNNKYNQRIID